MSRQSLAGIALVAATAVAGLGFALSGHSAIAGSSTSSFGPVTFHEAPTTQRIKVDPAQIRQHPGEPFAVWSGYSTYPEFTPGQKRMIEDALNSAKGGNGNGHGGGPAPSPSPSPSPTSGGGGGSSGGSVPYWVHASPDGKYSMSMVGLTSPYAVTSSSSANTVTYVPIVLKITINGTTYDPTQPACDDPAGVSVSDRFFNSPLFYSLDYNVNGTTISGQYIGAFQQANFWNMAHSAGNVTLVRDTNYADPEVPPTISLKGRNYTVTCKAGGTAQLGSVDINTFDSAIQSVIASLNVPPDELPIVLTSNVVLSYHGQCCILGYHNAVPYNGGVLTYATGTYVNSGVFTGIDDVSIWSHELGEWMDDPFVQAAVPGGGSNDVTPSWGNIGQVSGCQNNLEVGDPLTGTQFATGPVALGNQTNPFNYHLEDLAFKDWFYRTTPDSPISSTVGAARYYSFAGTFTGPAAACP